MFTHFKYNALKLKILGKFKNMSALSFIQNLNPITNKMEWKAVYDDYDYNQEIATSCYGDMLHDDERNQKFGEALKKAIQKLHAAGRKAHVLDIGTGTGLLSMLAVKFEADSVVACEAFLPMADCAINIVQENNLSDKIKVVKSHSTSLSVGEKSDLKQKANILVSEVFDTELIGEGAIKTFNHAFENLLEEDCIVIPSSGTVYAQVIESDVALKWNKLQDLKDGNNLLIKIPTEIKNCPGAAAVHDIQLNEFSHKHFKPLSAVIPVFSFEWAGNKRIPTFRQNKSVTEATSSGTAQAVFMWWDLKMDQEGEIIISCAPAWEHPCVKGKKIKKSVKDLTKMLPWRDHWMQAVYFFAEETILKERKPFSLISKHDEFSFWFQIEDSSGKNMETLRPVCNCAFHFLLSRTRIGAINDDRRRKSYLKCLKRLVNNDTVWIVLGDISLMGMISAKLGAKKVYILSEGPSADKVLRTLVHENNLSDVVSVRSSVSQIIESINAGLRDKSFSVIIFSEPHFRNSILPWDNMAFWFMREQIVHSLKGINQILSIQTFPMKGKLTCCAVQFDNLWKIATPLNTCQGFSMKIFDDLIGSAKAKAENYVEAQPLWEYPGIALTLPFTLFEFDFTENIPKKKVKSEGELKLDCDGRCDGIAFWMEYEFADECFLSFGPVEQVVLKEYISWDMFERQGVHLLRRPFVVNPGDAIYYEVEFDPQEAEFGFHFNF